MSSGKEVNSNQHTSNRKGRSNGKSNGSTERTDNDNLSIDIEEELARLDLESFDDLVDSCEFIEKSKGQPKHNKSVSKSTSNIQDKKRTSIISNSLSSLKNGKGSQFEGNPELKRSKGLPNSGESDVESPPFQTAVSDSGISSADTESSLKAFLLGPATLVYGSVYHGELDLLKMDKSKAGKPHANGTVGPDPSGSRRNLPEPAIPGTIVDNSILRSDLITAVEQNKVDKVRRILVSGVDPNAVCDTSGRWPLHIAALLGHSVIARLLLDFGAQKDQPDTNLERTPLLYASATSIETVQILLHYRVDINSRNKFGANALHYAAGAGQGECCKILASMGCDVNSRDRQKMTPLHMAARVDDIWSIEVLFLQDSFTLIGNTNTSHFP
ncbi:unnamed protein product [Allacma fusca]|uniref:Uncharacterized protein n=1 Tax=Allacma fusca TaxID=39272 RepID=A0A8J2L7H4_9HEXA|nr:unnamed protein product [Allacma fusca]